MPGAVRSNPLLAVIDEILRLQGCFEDLFAEVAGASSLSTLQKLVLFAVFDAPVPPTVPQIGRNLDRPRQVVLRVVNEMVELGLLEKEPNPHHKRAMLLIPSDKALEMKRLAEERAAATARAFLATISESKCEGLASELRALREALEAHVESEGLAEQSRSEASPPIRSALTLLEKLA